MPVLWGVRERCTFVIPLRTREFGYFQRGFWSAAARNRRNGGDLLSFRNGSLSMNLLSAAGISTCAAAEVFMCLLPWRPSVPPPKLALTTKHVAQQFAGSVENVLPLGGQSPENGLALQTRAEPSYTLSGLGWACGYGSTDSETEYILKKMYAMCRIIFLHTCKPTCTCTLYIHRYNLIFFLYIYFIYIFDFIFWAPPWLLGCSEGKGTSREPDRPPSPQSVWVLGTSGVAGRWSYCSVVFLVWENEMLPFTFGCRALQISLLGNT